MRKPRPLARIDLAETRPQPKFRRGSLKCRVAESSSHTGPPHVTRTRRSPRSSESPFRRPLPRLGLALLTIVFVGRLFSLLARLATRSLPR